MRPWAGLGEGFIGFGVTLRGLELGMVSVA